MASQILIQIDDRSQVGEARRAAQYMAGTLAFGEEQAGKLSLAVTEAATNIVKHAGSGKILLAPLQRATALGIEVLALDRGPGIADLRVSLRDGYSTSGTMGGGLGALSRMSPGFDLYSQPGHGTALRVEIWANPPGAALEELELGAVCVAMKGEDVAGDAWLMDGLHDYRTTLVVDGLGHGPNAARAAHAAMEVFATHISTAPGALMQLCHGALAATRGAAGAAARVVPSMKKGTFAGIGNISARVESGGDRRHLVSHSGTLGHVMRRVQEFEFDFPAGALLILHSDGLASHWTSADYPGLASKHAGLIAGVLYRDHERGRDDVTVVVLKNMAKA